MLVQIPSRRLGPDIHSLQLHLKMALSLGLHPGLQPGSLQSKSPLFLLLVIELTWHAPISMGYTYNGAAESSQSAKKFALNELIKHCDD